jgi:hypothetical protein
MPILKKTGIVVITLAIFLLPVVVAKDQPAKTTEHKADVTASNNVLLTFRLGPLEDGVRTNIKTYKLVVSGGGSGSRLLTGARVPLPTTRRPNDDTTDDITFVYQNIGFSAEVNAWMLADGRVKVIANIEDSRIGEEVEGRPATIETRQLSIDSILTPGTPLEVARVENHRGKSGFVEVEATLLPSQQQE